MKYAFIPTSSCDDHHKFLKECDPNYRNVKVRVRASLPRTATTTGPNVSDFFSYYAIEVDLSTEDLLVFKIRFPNIDTEFKLANDYIVLNEVSIDFK